MKLVAAGTPPNTPTFEEVIVPHLGAAVRLARRLMRNRHDAEDVVQEASLRALRSFRTFTGGNGRAWFLKIVRNTCWQWYGHYAQAPRDSFDEEEHSAVEAGRDPEGLALQADDARVVALAMEHMPVRFRELLALRELEGLSYRELAAAMDMPIGTVMSGLSRARRALRKVLDNRFAASGPSQEELWENSKARSRW
jgi:RNA polymerase sigma-70 factor (ECF subfamily)